MARVKDTIWQRDFSLLEVREDLLEADDTDLRKRSLQSARNCRAMATRVLTQRPGTFYLRNLNFDRVIDVEPADGVKFGMVTRDNDILMLNETGGTVASISPVPWSNADGIWVLPLRDEVVIGDPSTGIYSLTYSGGSWTLQDFEFDEAPGGEKAQPYWVFKKGSRIRPSARYGNISITADSDVFSSGHIGSRIRYGQREIQITGVTTPRLATGTVISKLPPSFRITMTGPIQYRIGETVVGSDTNFQGVIVGFNEANRTIDVVTTNFFDGPDNGEDLSSESFTAVIQSKVEISPLTSNIWDEQMMSAVHGWPRSATSRGGRLFFVDFPAIPSMIAVSSARSIRDWKTGSNDDDAITREIGSNAPQFRHAVDNGDVLLLADKGCYYLNARDGSTLTPQNFNPVRFDKRGASRTPPVLVDDAVVFIEANEKTVSAALLSGNVYLKWTVRSLTLMHNHLIEDPVMICGPNPESSDTENYLFIVNADGTLAAASWSDSFGDRDVGIAPWDTDGHYVGIFPVFGTYWCAVDRKIAGGTVRMLERFSDEAWMDCTIVSGDGSAPQILTIGGAPVTVQGEEVVVSEPGATHLPGKNVAYMFGDAYAGEWPVNADGTMDDEPDLDGERQIGLHYDSRAKLWPVEVMQSPRLGLIKARVYKLVASMQNTVSWMAICNGKSRVLGGYSVGDNLALPPARRTKVYKVPVFGAKDHPDLEIVKHQPGPWWVLAAAQEVQG